MSSTIVILWILSGVASFLMGFGVSPILRHIDLMNMDNIPEDNIPEEDIELGLWAMKVDRNFGVEVQGVWEGDVIYKYLPDHSGRSFKTMNIIAFKNVYRKVPEKVGE